MLSLFHRHPLEILQSELRAQDQMINSSAPVWQPRFDIMEEEHAFILEADLPGVNQESLKIEVHEDLLTVRGERSGFDGEGTLLRRERQSGSFARSFRLSEKVSKASIQAQMKDGVLRLELQKVLPEEPKTIQVQFH